MVKSSMSRIMRSDVVDAPVGSEGGRRPSTLSTGHNGAGGAASGPLIPGQRWSVNRKREAVLRLLRGEAAEAGNGCPVAVEVFEGNTADPMTLSSQIDKLKQRFKLQRVVMVGDRGLLTSARIEETLRPAGLDWITALRAPAIRALAAEGGPLQPSLFDARDMAEIDSPDFPGERLVVCKNPLLGQERARKRGELLAATEKELIRIQARAQRANRKLHGAAAIGQAVGAA